MNPILDAEEFLQLANHYTEKEDYAQALKIAKEGRAAFPDDSKLLYLTGALHAQIGMYDQAKQEMQEAVQQNPDLTTAHFQLGLLHLTSGDIIKAEGSWQALDTLSEKHPLQLFRHGMMALARDEFDLCIKHLQDGIKNNIELPALNDDMQKVIASVHENTNTPNSTAHKGKSAQYFLANYGKPTKN